MIRLALRVIVGLVLAAVVWWVGPLIAIGVYHPLSARWLLQVLVALILLWAFWPLIALFWGALFRGASRVRPWPKRRAREPDDPVRHRLRELDAQLRRAWLRGRTGWRQRWRARHGTAHLDGQPWFMVLGARGSGKSTWIRRGALGLTGSVEPGEAGPDDAAVAEATHDVEFELWRNERAVWIDVAGHWMAPNGAASESADWSRLLQGLRSLQRVPTLDGVLLCFDCDWLLHAHPEHRKRTGEALRVRLLDLAGELGVVLPLYVALTGLDRVDGALEVLEGIDDPMLGAGIGFGLAAEPIARGRRAAAAEDAGPGVELARCERAMRRLEERLQQHVQVMAPLAREPGSNRRRLEFVERLAALRRHLGDLLQRCGGAAPASATGTTAAGWEGACVLRGVWLGTSVDLVDGLPTFMDDPLPLAGGAANDGDGGWVAGARRLAASWSGALGQMLAEHGLARPGAGVRRGLRQRLAGAARWAVVAGVLAGLAGLLAHGWWAQRNYLAEVAARFAEGQRLAEMPEVDPAPTSALSAVTTQMRYARYAVDSADAGSPSDAGSLTWRAAGAPYWENWRVAEVSRATYHRHLRQTLAPTLYNEVRRSLASELAGQGGDLYETLKVYLMLVRPAHRDAAALTRWMARRWQRLVDGSAAPAPADEAGVPAGDGVREAERREALSHLRALFEEADLPATPEDEVLVRQARAQAAQVPSIARVLAHIRAGGLPAGIEDVSLARAGGFVAATTLRLRGALSPTDAVVSGWYTRAGYNDVLKPRLHDAARAVLEEEGWVLRDEQPAQRGTFEVEQAVQRLADATRAQFLQDYIRRWQAFLNDVTIRRYAGMDDAAQLAASLIDPQSPLAQLLRFAGRETSLTGNYEGEVASWIDRQKYNLENGRRAIVGEISGEHFRNRLLPEHVVEDHFEDIRQLATQITRSAATGGGSNPMSRLFEPLYRQLSLVNGAMMAGQVLPEYDAFARLRSEAARQPQPLRGIMLDLVDSGSRSSSTQARVEISRSAAGAARSFCDQGSTARYPLDRAARAEVGIVDFQNLFGPQGTLATHFREKLAPYVDTASTPWRARRVEGSGPLVGEPVLRAFEAAERIRASLLDASGALHLSTMLRFIEMDPQLAEAQLEIGAARLRFAHGSSAAQRIDWSGQAAGGSAPAVRLFLRGVDGRSQTLHYEGPWALWRLFDAGRMEGREADRRQTVHATPIGSVRLEWQSLTTPSPLWSDLLQQFRCPR